MSPTRRPSSRSSIPIPPASGRSVLDALIAPSTPLVVQLSRGDATYRFEGCSTRRRVDDRPRGRLAALGHGGRPHARARSRGEGRRLARQRRQHDRRGDLLVLRLRERGRVDARRPRSRRPRRAPARQRSRLRAGAGREVGVRGLPRGHGHPRRRALPSDRSPRRRAGRALARLRQRRPARDGQRTAGRGPAREGVADPGPVRLGADRRRRRGRPGAGLELARRPDDDAARTRTTSAARSIPRRPPTRSRGARRSAPGSRSRSMPTASTCWCARASRCSFAGWARSLSGRYLVERVRHTVTLDRHRQQLTLVRNALGLTGDESFGSAIGIGVPL